MKAPESAACRPFELQEASTTGGMVLLLLNLRKDGMLREALVRIYTRQVRNRLKANRPTKKLDGESVPEIKLLVDKTA